MSKPDEEPVITVLNAVRISNSAVPCFLVGLITESAHDGISAIVGFISRASGLNLSTAPLLLLGDISRSEINKIKHGHFKMRCTSAEEACREANSAFHARFAKALISTSSHSQVDVLPHLNPRLPPAR